MDVFDFNGDGTTSFGEMAFGLGMMHELIESERDADERLDDGELDEEEYEPASPWDDEPSDPWDDPRENWDDE